MTLSIKTSVRTSRADAINNAIGASGKVKVYTGTAPTSVNDTATGTLLAECVCNATAFGTVTSGVLNADNVSGQSYVGRDDSANATGTAGYIRITDSSDVAILQEDDLGTSGSGAAIILSSMSITSGNPVEVSSFSITEANP